MFVTKPDQFFLMPSSLHPKPFAKSDLPGCRIFFCPRKILQAGGVTGRRVIDIILHQNNRRCECRIGSAGVSTFFSARKKRHEKNQQYGSGDRYQYVIPKL